MSTANFAEVPPEMDEAGEPAGPAPTVRSLAVRAAVFGAGVAALLGIASTAAATTDGTNPAPKSGVGIPSPTWNSTCCVNGGPTPTPEVR